MPSRHVIVHSDAMVAHQLPSWHPLKPGRAASAVQLLQENPETRSRVSIIDAASATNLDVLRVHDESYVEVVDCLSQAPQDPKIRNHAFEYGFTADGDNPPYLHMGVVARHVSGAVIAATEHVRESGGVAFVPSAGANHHARRNRASGFGVFNDVAIAIAHARARGLRVVYVDLDVHHGDGVEEAFVADPGVLTISLHEDTRYLFPGLPNGEATRIGCGAGRGFAVNVPLTPYTDDVLWIEAFDAVVPPLIEAFAPDLIVTQWGADGYHADPLAHLLLSERAYVQAAQRLRSLANGNLIATGGGGYDVEATPRLWASVFATLIGVTPPATWLTGPVQPPALNQEARTRIHVENRKSIETVRRLVFPYHGLQSD